MYGALYISGAINNLLGLSQLTAVHGELDVYETQNLLNLTGLDNIQSLDGHRYLG